MHRKSRSLVLRIAVALCAAAATALTAFLFASSSSAAAPGDSVDATNSHVDAQCALNTTTVTSGGQTIYHMSSQGFPSSWAGYVVNLTTETDCTVLDMDNGGAVVATWNRSANGPILGQQRNTVSLPASGHYVVCAQGKVLVSETIAGHNKQSWTPVVCSS